MDLDSGVSGTIYSDLLTLYHDFENLATYAYEQDSSGYNGVASTTTTDIRALWTDCSTG